MTRRMLDSAIFQNEKFGVMPPMARLLTIGIINQADDQGRGKANPVYLRSQVFPYDDVTPEQVASWLALVAQNETITIYTVDGKDYYQVVNWWKYQSHQYAMPSQFPKPPGWRDRIRKSLTKGLIVTCNWTTTDGKQSPDTCDEQGLAIHLNEQVNNGLNIQVYVKDKVEVEDKGDEGVASKNVVVPPTAPAAAPKAVDPKFQERTQMTAQYQAVLGAPSTAIYPEMIGYMNRLQERDAVAWWSLALTETTTARRPGWQYMKAVLESWLAAGKPNGKPNGTPAPTQLAKPLTEEEEYAKLSPEHKRQVDSLRAAERARAAREGSKPNQGRPSAVGLVVAS